MNTKKEGRTLLKGGTVVTMDPKVPNLAIGDVLVEGGRIAAVAPIFQRTSPRQSTPRAASSCRASSTPIITCGLPSCVA